MDIEETPKNPLILCVACEKDLASNRLIFNQEHGIAAPLCDNCLHKLGHLLFRSPIPPPDDGPVIFKFHYYPLKGYACSQPGDNTRYYINLNDYERLLFEALKGAKIQLADAPEKLLRYAEVIQVLENEIKWCVDNPDKGFNAEYNKGFINALIQAKYLVTQLAQLDKKEIGYMGDIGGIPDGPFDK